MWDSSDYQTGPMGADEELETCKTRVGHFTGQVICTRCAPDCEHYLCTDEDA